MVNTPYPWGNPHEIDQLITQKIEKKVKNLEGVKKISSTSMKNISSTMIEINDDVEVTTMSSKIKDALSSVLLPENAEEPVVTEVTMNKNQLFTLILYAQDPKMDIRYLKEKANLLKHNLEGWWWIDTIEVDWWNTYEIEILIDKNKLENLGLSLTQVAALLQSSTNNQPLGNHEIGEKNYDFRIEGEIRSEAELANIPIALGNGKTIPLGQLAEFKKTYKDDSTVLHIGESNGEIGKLAVSLQFTKPNWASILQSSKKAKQTVAEELKKTEYKWLGSFYTVDLGEFIGEDYNDLAINGITTLLIVFIIVLAFVGAKESFIATLSIPLAFFVTFFVLKSMGLSLNFLTNFSLIICLGIAIDTATVIIQWASENIKLWYKPINAALLSVKTYKNALISGTATTAVVFLPMLTLPGIMGKFLAYIPTTIFVTLIASLFISLTITPVLFFKFSNNKKKYQKNPEQEGLLSVEEQLLLSEDREWKNNQETDTKIEKTDIRDTIFPTLLNRYEKKLSPLLATSKRRIITILIPFVLLIFTAIFISPRLWFLMMPEVDQEYLMLTITGKEGTTTKELLNQTKEVDQIIWTLPELKNYTNTIKDNVASITIRIAPKAERKRDSFKIEDDLEGKLYFLQEKWLRVETIVQQNWPEMSAEVWIKLHAENQDQMTVLSKVAEDFKNFLNTIPGTKNIKSDSEESPGEFIFTLDKERLSLLGLTQRDLAPELYFALNGLKAWTLKGKEEIYDLKVKYADFKKGADPQKLMGTFFNTKSWKTPLGTVWNYTFAPATSKIIRENGKITITVESNLQKNAKAEPINAELVTFAESYPFPEGISYEKGGETEENADLITAMLSAFLFALICIFGILVLQFNSYTQPWIIVYSVIMGFLGATYWMLITWNPYGMLFLIWFIALTGIVVNNAIILIDTANENCKRWETKFQAMKESAKSRLKPILSTTLTTVIGLVTLTTDGFFAPLAWTIIFGLSIATIMTLFVIPALYQDEDTIRYIIKRMFIKPLLKIIVPIIGLGCIWIICIILNINLFNNGRTLPFVFSFIITSIILLTRYWYLQNIKGESWYIQKMLHLQLLTENDAIITKKQLIKRESSKRGILLGPALFAWILLGIAKIIGSYWLEIIWSGFVGISYIIIILWNIYSLWISEKKQTWRDKISWTQMKDFHVENS